MARIRTVKPEFWLNEELALLPPETRLLAIGLLNQSDDEGYFRAHPIIIKSAIFPFAEGAIKVPEMLSQLCQAGYIKVTTGIDGKPYGCVVNFKKHQAVNRPSPSKIKHLCNFTEDSVNTHGAINAHSLPEGNREKEHGREVEQGKTTLPTPAGVARCPVDQIIEAYKQNAPSLVQPRIVTDATKAQISARWRQSAKHQDIEFWQRFFAYCESTDFLAGRAQGRDGKKPFRASLEWVVNAGNFAKIVNGNYDNGGRT